jgi:exonuclease SbcD
MKILHTSDWHLGRQFFGQPLEADHAAILAQVLTAVRAHRPDVLVIAGDIFDRASPPAPAVRQFNNFVETIASESETAIVMIAGNHDSGDRIASIGTLADRKRVLIRGPLSPEEYPLILEDAYGPVAFSGLPYGNEFAARECYDKRSIACPADVLAAQIGRARAQVPESARWVIVAHTFVANSIPCECERRLIGGIETVPPSLFDGAHYVALGHLHRPQNGGAPHIRYSGAPLAFGFDESDTDKSMTLVNLRPDGSVSSELLPFKPQRRVRVLKGLLADLLTAADDAPSEDFFKIILADKGALIDPMGQVRARYPNAMVLSYERDEDEKTVVSGGAAHTSLDDPVAVVGEFLTYVRGEGSSDKEMALITAALNELAAGEEHP